MKTLSTRLASLSPKQRALLERRLKERGVTASDLPIPPRVEPRSTFPLTFAQERLWFLFRMDPADPAYNLATGDRLCGVLDVSALLRAFDEIVRRHESLRTRFPDVDGKPIQLVGSRMGLEIPHLDLGRLGENHRHAETRRLSREQNQRPFDLARGPLLRCTLFRLAADDHVLAFTMHHIISDGVSIDVLLREVSALYHAFSRRRPSPLAKLPIQYGDFAVWQRQQLTVEQLDEQLAYWRERLADLPPVLELPADRPRPAVGSFRGGSVAVALPRPLTSVLRALARRQGATLFVTLLAAFKLLLGRITGQQDLAVGIPVSGRDRLETEGLIGFFINTLVLRSDHSDNPGWLELLARVHRLVLDAHDHQDLPFARLVEELRPPRSLSYTPIFQVMFTLLPAQTQPQRTGDSPGLSLAPYGSELGAATHDLSLSLEDAGAEIRGQLSYNTDLFDHTTVARIAGHLQVLLRAVTDESATGRLSDLPMLSPPEQQVLLREWNAPASVSPTGTLLEMFAAQVDRTPDAVAVACGPLRLTYQELDHRANRLAHALRGRGVAPEVVVGVLLERSPELVIAVLAVLEAGGAYLPLDPAQPAERLAFMIDDARVPILLTEPPLSQELRLESSPAVIGLDGTGSLAAGSEEIPSLPPLRGNPALVPLRGNPALVPLRGNPALVPLRGNLAGGAEGENLAYLIYTSGSTGRPKGTELRHAGLLNLITWHQEIYRVAPGDRATLVASPGFDASVWEIWPNLTAGATLHIPAPATVASPPDLLAWLAAEGITLSFLPTPLAEALLAEPLPPRLSLRALLTGGDKLHHSPKRALPFDLVNHYGPTESTVVTSWTPVAPGVRSPPIGRPLTHTRVYLLTAGLQPVPLRVPGELHVGGLSLARGYRRHAALTAERFIPDPLSDTAGERLYKTGDRVRYQADGQLEFLGRLDRQVKVRGFRIELGEIEAVLNAQPAIREAAVLHREIRGVGAKALVAYVVAQARSPGQAAGLRELLGDKLPTFMVPSVFVFMEALPLLPNGKLDRRALPQPDRPESAAYLAPSGETERTIAAIWQELLRIERVGTHDSFFDLGGHSLLLAQVQSKLQQAFGREIPMVELFRHPTVSALAGFLAPQRGAELQEQPGLRRAELRRESVQQTGSEIAIIAMTGRFPAADNIDELWRNLREGVESVTFYSDEELLAAGVDPAVLKDPHYVKAGTSLDKPEWFDAQLFGISPREAELMDPQQRIFLECAWEALELAGYDPQGYGGAIGVYAGIAINHYLVNLYSNPQETGGAGGLQLMVGNDKDFLPTRVSYKLNLKGPSVTVQTACSTSLVATHLACQGLLHGECDMALAGGVSISNYRKAGYFYQEEGIMSPDGHCRAFDARAQGTVPGNGAGLVVLKRLTDALEDGDTIRAVIKGSAINNDGSGKIGFTAPSIEGQTAVIAEALAMAGVEPREVSYVEAHGTATPLGDPIEVAALKNVFGSEPGRSCALGSVKTNFGHLDTAAGVTGLIKTVLALEHRQIPPSLHFEQPNPEIDLEHSPFYVNTVHREWPAGPGPRRAGVSSFGLGGTNAHLVLEEAPGSRTSDPPGPRQLLVLSARTGEALEQATTRLAEHFRQHPELNLADAAYTLQVGRQACEHRRILVGRDPADAAAALLARDPARVVTREAAAASPSLVFLFPGQGAQAVNMGRELYEVAPVFRHEVDRAAEILRPHLGLDVRSLLYPLPEESEAAEEQLRQTALTQPALFVVEHALARLWMDLVGPPKAMIGHSLGEYVAACLAGVFSLEDALYLVAERGRLMGAQPAGAMLAVPLAESEVAPLLGPELDLAAVNAAQRTVVAGPAAAIEALAESLADRNVETRRLETSHAFHSASMEPVLEPFRQCLRRIDLQAPQIPFVSNLTGDWIDPSEATDPDTWVRHLRSTVRFSEGLDRLLDDPDALFLEIGPGRTLSSLLRRQGKEAAECLAIPSLATDSNAGELTAWLTAVGRLWASGYRVDWRAFQAGQRRHRVALPTYPFERQPYWIEPGQAPATRRQAAKRDLEHWFYVPTWKLSAPLPAAELAEQGALCLLLGDSGGLAEQVGERLRAVGWQVVTACSGPGFTRRGDRAYEIDPGRPQNYGELIAALLEQQGAPPRHIVHCWSLTGPQRKEGEPLETVQARGFDSLLCLTRALEEQGVIDPVTVTVLSDGVQSVDGAERLAPAKATLLGALKVIPQECPNLACRSIDVRLPEPGSWEEEDLSVQLAVETVTEVGEAEVAYRPTGRWVRRFEAIPVPEKVAARPRLREHGVYLLTGGLGRIGLALAEFLGRTLRARLILLGRSSFPAREEWSRILDEGDEDQAESQDSLAGALGRAWGDRQDLRPKIRQLRELEEAGAEVLVLRADVTDPQQMAEAIRRARQRFGEIHGVVHLAGELQRAVMPIAETDPETSRRQFAPKVRGTLILDELLADSTLDFCLLFSSLSSVLGGLGFASYAAANAFLDAWAHYRRGHPVPWMSVSWDGWRFRLGEPLDRPPPGEPGQAASEHDLVMEPAEGVEAFRRVLSLCRNPQIVVSTGDLEARIATWVTSRHGAEGQPAREKSAASAQRPQLSSSYVPPGNAIEEALVAIWQQEIGFEQVGIHDRFFELGGDSLLGIQVISRCRQAGFELTPKQLFEQPTIAELAKLLADADGAAHEERPADTGTADAPAAEAAADSDFSDSGLEPEQLQKVLAQLAELP